MSKIVIPETSQIYSVCQSLAQDAKVIFTTGLPGVGKSLYVQQLATMAQQMGRSVHLLQWDVIRSAFESDEILTKYPEIDGVTHAMIRKAVGTWTRSAVSDWLASHADDSDLLIGEAPLVGERLMQLAKVYDDDAEARLASTKTQFLLPVPSAKVRAMIEAKRAQSIANPQHENETKDAPPNVLEMMWHEIHGVGAELGFCDALDNPAYDADAYRKTYEYLLQYRHCNTLRVDEVFARQGSVYDLDNIAGHLQATSEEVTQIMTQLESDMSVYEVEADVEGWHRFENPPSTAT